MIQEFRAWDKKLLKFNYFDFRHVLPIYGNPDEFVVTQYTGQADIESEKIFEGDIVDACWIGKPERGVVIYWYGEFRICYLSSYNIKEEKPPTAIGNMWYCSLTEALTASPKYRFRIIGNIFQNPDLTNPKR